MSDEKPFFTAEDFGGLAREFWFPEFLEIANEKLRGCSRGRKACDLEIEALEKIRQRLIEERARLRDLLQKARTGWCSKTSNWELETNAYFEELRKKRLEGN